MSDEQQAAPTPPPIKSDAPFLWCFGIIGASYVLLILLMILADLLATSPGAFMDALADENIQYSIKFSLISCTISAIISVWIAVPIAYIMSRFTFRGKAFIDAVLDIPIVMPPLVVGISLMLLFAFLPAEINRHITLAKPAVIIAQVAVACAFAVRTLRITFDQIPQRYEQVAMTLGTNRSQAFWMVILPQARNGFITAFAIAWARALGEFGPILVFAGSTRMYTEVMPTTVFLELQAGNLEAVAAVSLIMIIAAVLVLVCMRIFGLDRISR